MALRPKLLLSPLKKRSSNIPSVPSDNNQKPPLKQRNTMGVGNRKQSHPKAKASNNAQGIKAGKLNTLKNRKHSMPVNQDLNGLNPKLEEMPFKNTSRNFPMNQTFNFIQSFNSDK